MIVGSDSDSEEFTAPEPTKYEPDGGSIKQVSSLQVIIHECRYLVSKNKLRGKSDPYVQIRLLDVRGKTLESVRTPAKKSTLNPVFHEQVFNKWRYSTIFSSMVVQVWNKSLVGSDSFLGQVSFNAKDLQFEEKGGWMKLAPRRERHGDRVQGEIKLQIFFSKSESAALVESDRPALFVTVLEGRNIDPWPEETQKNGKKVAKTKPRPGFNSCNPYFMAKFGADTVKGPTLKRTYHPMWAHQHCFVLDEYTSHGVDSTGVLDIKVMHWDRLSPIFLDKHVGSVSVPLSEFHPSVTVDKWYPLEGGQGKDAWVHLLVKHHDPVKMRRHLAYTFGLFFLVVLVGLMLELLVRLVTGLPALGFLLGASAGAFLPTNVWKLYNKSFELFPFLAPMKKLVAAPAVAQPLSGLGLPTYNALKWKRKVEKENYSLPRRHSMSMLNLARSRSEEMKSGPQ